MKNVLILGAASDISIALAHEFGRRNYSLTLASRRPDELKECVADFAIRYDQTPRNVEFDARKMDGHRLFYDTLEPKPDIVISVFGYLGDQIKAEKDWNEARQIIETNYTGAVSILDIVAGDFEQKRRGAIIGVSSVAGERGRQSNYLYGSAKAGFTAYLSGLRNRLFKAGVHVITVKPGFVRTKMTAGMDLPARVAAEPEQVAQSIYRAYIKGKNVVYTRWMWRYIMWVIRGIPEGVFKRLSL